MCVWQLRCDKREESVKKGGHTFGSSTDEIGAPFLVTAAIANTIVCPQSRFKR